MWEKPVGIFDSGLGGLTALKEISKIMPNEDIVYFGDTGRAPYGDKDTKTLLMYAKQNLSFLINQDVKLILAACGTISSLNEFSKLSTTVPLEGVIDSACASAVKATKNGEIAVIGTSSAIKSKAYETKIHSLMPEAKVYQRACPRLVPLIESGKIDYRSESLVKCLNEYLDIFRNSTVDTMILGCTHYPLIESMIKETIGRDIALINSGKEAAKSIFNLFKAERKFSTKNSQGNIEIFVSGDKEKFLKTAGAFLKRDIEKNLNIVDVSKWRQQ